MKKENNKGFTLVELIVVMAMMLLLSTLSVAGILEYQDYANYKRVNSYAQTLFVAAQSQLTQYSVRGEMDQLEDIDYGVLNLSDVILPSGKKIAAKDADSAMEGKTIYYLTGTAKTYENYLAGVYESKTDSTSRTYQALYDIFDSYLYDKSILRAAIAIEYNPEEGLVYSVLYSDRVGAFTYEEESTEGKTAIGNRTEDYRSVQMIGYYGVD